MASRVHRQWRSRAPLPRLAGAALLLAWRLTAGAADSIDWNDHQAAVDGDDGIHDPTTGYREVLQPPAEAFGQLPMDRLGKPDWAKAIREGLIQPRADLTGTGEMSVFNLDIIMTDTRSMPHVRFPHEIHSRWLDCSNCHPAIFIPISGANRINMDGILRGEFCGICHGRVAFSPFACERCHSVPHPGSPKPWW